jgi:hypothetical protein
MSSAGWWITTNVEAVNPDSMQAMFPEVLSGKLEGESGRVSLLVGQDNLKFFPVENRRNSDAGLHRSRFGTGWVASGKPSDKPVVNQRRKKSPARPKAEKPLEVTTLAVTTASREGGYSCPWTSCQLKHWGPTCPGAASLAWDARNANSGRTQSPLKKTKNIR